MSDRHDVAVVGAGILGLATARALLLARPGLRIAVLDKEPDVGKHQTGHNSGVVHSGIYYKPGSMKAALCLRGKRLLEEYAAERGIEIAQPGKLIVALDEAELGRLDELKRRAVANGVAGLRELDAAALREIEPNAVGLRALHAAETGVIDYGRVARSLAKDIQRMGGAVLLGREVVGLDRTADMVVVRTNAGPLESRRAIACAGLQADRIARLAGAKVPARIVPFRGDYYTLRGASETLVNGLLYPVPDPNFPFLGVHFTKRIDGSVIAGPNAVLALAREGYRRAALSLRDAASALAYSGVRRFALRHARVAVGEMWRDASKRAFVADMQRYVPGVDASDVTFGPSGIRAQAMTPDGRLVDDFLIVGSPRMMHVLNAPSPAATASLAIGEEIAERAFRELLD